MVGEKPEGICPHCGGSGGAPGTPCTESVCKRQGYHYIPEVHAKAVHGADGPGVSVDPQIGRKVDRYILVGTIGTGGMGSVYLALQMPLEREVALKMVSGVTLDETSQGRFEREAKAISMLYHPNIVQLYEYGFNPLTGTPFMALEYVKGGRELVDMMIGMREREEPWMPERVEHVFGQVLSALQTAHSQALVHRDIKPQNIMLVDVEGNPDFVKILDFGLARTLGQVPGMDRLTGTGTVVGTPQYMAPEQLVGGGAEVDRRSDLYGVGAILFEVVTGLTAYPGTDPRAVLSLKLDSDYDPMERLPLGALHPPIRSFLMRALARDTKVRFGSATEMREALLRALDGAPPMGLGLGADPTLSLSGAETAAQLPLADEVDAEAATVASDELLKPRTEQLSAFERASAPGTETLESELDVPGKVPGRLVLAGTLTGVGIIALALLFVFVILPRLGSRPPVEVAEEAAFADASPPPPDTPSPEGEAIAEAMETQPGVEEPGTFESTTAPRPKPKPRPRPKDASTQPPDPGDGVVVPPPPVDPPPKDPDPEPPPPDPEPPPPDPEPPPPDPEPTNLPSTPPMKLIHAKLKALTPAIKQCLPKGQGQVTIGVVFAAESGKVKKVKISGFYSGGGQTKNCIRSAVKTVDVSPWEGSDVGVPYTYSFGPAGDDGISAEDLLKAAVKKKFQKARSWLVACAGNTEGTAKVRVTVNGKTGKVKIAEVLDAPFANTPEGECMEKALEKVVVFPTFDKEEATFTHTYKLP